MRNSTAAWPFSPPTTNNHSPIFITPTPLLTNMKKTFLRKVLLAVTLVLSSTAAVGQIPITITKDGRVEFAGTGNPKTDDLMSRIQLHGYAQGGAFYNSRVLYLIASVFAPMAAVLLVSHYVVRRFHPAWNLVAWLAGFLAYGYLIYLSPAASPIGPTLTAMLLSGLLTLLGLLSRPRP